MMLPRLARRAGRASRGKAVSAGESKEPTIASEYIYRGRIVDLRLDTVRLPNGATTRREIVEHRGAVGIVPVDDDGNVTLVRQFRKPIERSILEIPAGTLDAGEDVLACVHRELREETGLVADRVEPLVAYYSAVGFCTERMDLFLATGLHGGEAGADEDEFIEVETMPLAQALALIERGEIVDAKTIIGLLLARDKTAAGAGRASR